MGVRRTQCFTVVWKPRAVFLAITLHRAVVRPMPPDESDEHTWQKGTNYHYAVTRCAAAENAHRRQEADGGMPGGDLRRRISTRSCRAPRVRLTGYSHRDTAIRHTVCTADAQCCCRARSCPPFLWRCCFRFCNCFRYNGRVIIIIRIVRSPKYLCVIVTDTRVVVSQRYVRCNLFRGAAAPNDYGVWWHIP